MLYTNLFAIGSGFFGIVVNGQMLHVVQVGLINLFNPNQQTQEE
jgi:hypothetical protein